MGKVTYEKPWRNPDKIKANQAKRSRDWRTGRGKRVTENLAREEQRAKDRFDELMKEERKSWQ